MAKKKIKPKKSAKKLVRSSKAKITFISKKLITFIILCAISFVLYTASSNEFLLNLFFLLTFIFGFVSLAFLIVLIVSLILKSMNK